MSTLLRRQSGLSAVCEVNFSALRPYGLGHPGQSYGRGVEVGRLAGPAAGPAEGAQPLDLLDPSLRHPAFRRGAPGRFHWGIGVVPNPAAVDGLDLPFCEVNFSDSVNL